MAYVNDRRAEPRIEVRGDGWSKMTQNCSCCCGCRNIVEVVAAPKVANVFHSKEQARPFCAPCAGFLDASEYAVTGLREAG